LIQRLKVIHYDEELIRTLFKAKSGFIGSNLIGPLVIIFLMKDFVPFAILSVWFILQIIVFGLRFKVSFAGLQALQNGELTLARLLLKQYLWLIFVNAFLLGISSFFSIFYTDVEQTLLLLFVITTITAGSLATLTPVYHAVFIFITTTLTSFIMGMLIGELESVHLLIIAGLLIYILIILPSSFRIYNSLAINRQDVNNFKHLVNSSLEAVVISDEEKNIVETNSVAVSMFGFETIEDAIGKNLSIFLPNDIEALKIQKALSQPITVPYEVNLKKRDGTLFPVLAAGRDIVRGVKKYRLTTLIDLSELKEKEYQMLQQSRLAQLGEMISMIAHQWKQPLSAIATTSANLKLKLLLNTFDLDTKEGQVEQKRYFEKELKHIDTLINNLTLTIDDFRNFYKPSKQKIESSLDIIVQKSLNIIGPSLENNNIKVKYTAQSVTKMLMYENEMVQVVLNIFQNAQDNFKEKKSEKSVLMIDIKKKTLRISDNGGGVHEDLLEQIFNPYFSTKDEKNGTGLGLYMSKVIVENHHDGKLSVMNLNEGACFEIQL